MQRKLAKLVIVIVLVVVLDIGIFETSSALPRPSCESYGG